MTECNDKPKMDYRNKKILAPMVRVGTLPMRLLALKYGADIVYTEELIDWKFLRSMRKVNDILNTVDYIDQSDGTIVFRTCSIESSKVVLQIGTCDPERALKVAKMVENDVAAIDINMGCPKEFSIKGGMGVALLGQREKSKAILKTLVENLSIPVSCKIRIFPTKEETLEVVENLVSSGISCIAIHGRTKDERPQHQVHSDVIKYIASKINIPTIANGGSKEIEKYSDIEKFKKSTGCSSVMLARAAEWNCSIFRKEGLLPLDNVIVEYLKLAVDYDNSPSNTKYCVQNMLRELQDTPRGRQFLDCQTLLQICEIWDLGDYCRTVQADYQARGIQGRWQVTPDLLGPPNKKLKVHNLEGVTQLKVKGKAIDRDNVLLLLDLISEQKAIMLKTTDAFSNKMKDDAWKSIADKYCEISGEARRTEQLRLKWDNLKKTARKYQSHIKESILRVCFIRSNFPSDVSLPKTVLHVWAGKKGLKLPTYHTDNEEKLFRTIITFEGKKYASTFWEKNKKFAEQGAALVCLCCLGVISEDVLKQNGSLL